MSTTHPSGVAIDGVTATACTIPVDAAEGMESDGTISWKSTTIVIVEAHAGPETGYGYTYGDAVIADLVERKLAEVVAGIDSMATEQAWWTMAAAVRNLGRPGIASHAISAVDVALWDLKARLLGLPLFVLLGAVRDRVAIYGSGGFCSYDDGELRAQLGGWAADAITRVKMKVGRDPAVDEHRVAVAREAIGDGVELMVDANGAWTVPQALAAAHRWRERFGITWIEEPVSSDDLRGLRLIRDRAPEGVAIAAGEYGYTPDYFWRMLNAGAVDVLQADATRCGGVTGILNVGAQCVGRGIPLSAHTAPAIHAHIGCAIGPLEHVEYFHDHARIERMLFDGAPKPRYGTLVPDPSIPGLGIIPRPEEVTRWAV